MVTTSQKKFSGRIVLISEEIPFRTDVSAFDETLEGTSVEASTRIKNALTSCGYEFEHYRNPKDFMAAITRHSNDLVIISWSGSASASRVSIVPAICEGAGIRYVGADASTRAICNDKELSKIIARKLGFKTARGLRFLPEDGLQPIEQLSFPVIAKPCMEGSSIGISKDSVCVNRSQVEKRVRELWAHGFEHVYVEEFIVGKEVCICVMGANGQSKYSNAVEVYLEEDPLYFLNNPYDARIKKGLDGTRKLKLLEKNDIESDLRRAERAFSYLEKVNLLRVDGRLDESGCFTFIEFATMPTFGETSEVFFSMKPHLISFENFIAEFIALELK